MTDIHNFKEETFALIKQQTTTIKALTKDMEIKDQQIRLLKQTISSLEDEKEYYIDKYNESRLKIQTMLKEVSHYNETVVQKLFQENDMMKNKMEEDDKHFNLSTEQLQKLKQQVKDGQQKINLLTHQLCQTNKKVEENVNQNGRLSEQLKRQSDENSKSQKRVIKLESLNEQMCKKNEANEKQIESLLSKCQEITANYEKKIKKLLDNFVEKHLFTKLEEQIKNLNQKINSLKNSLYKIGRQKEQAKLQQKLLLEKHNTSLIKEKVDAALIKTDLQNIFQSLKMGKKICEFESRESQILDKIYEQFWRGNEKKEEVKEKVGEWERKNEELCVRIEKLRNGIEERDEENKLLREKMRNEMEILECSYESKIIQLSIKIQKQEKAIYELNIKTKQYQNLKLQYDKVVEEHVNQTQYSENTIQQYKNENQKLMKELQQLLHLCDENIYTNNCLNHLKRILHDLLSLIFYLYSLLLSSKSQVSHLYNPFIANYFKLKQKEKRSPIKKFRTAVWAVLACERIKKMRLNEGREKGLQKHVENSLKYRIKIENVNEHLEKLMQNALQKKEIMGLIKCVRGVYRWNEKEYLQIKLNDM